MRAVFAFLTVLALGGVVRAEEDTKPLSEEPKSEKSEKSDKSDSSSKSSDEFETTWFGVRLGVWYQPTINMQARVGGTQGSFAQFIGGNTKFDAHDDLGVKTNTPVPSDIDFSAGPPEVEMFVDTRWVSISLWGVMPFAYRGEQLLTRTIGFAGFSFQAQRPVETTLEQFIAGLDIKVNVFNNRIFRLSPVLAFRAIGLNWRVEDKGTPSLGSATTEDIDLPVTAGRFKILPYPEVGGEVRVGYRDYIEVDVKLTMFYVDYAGVRAKTALFEAGLTGYLPFFPYVGVRVGYRYDYVYIRTNDQDSGDQFETTLRLYGPTFSVILRF